MGETVVVGGTKRRSILGRVPWTFALIAYLVATRFAGIALEGTAGYVFVGLGLFVLFAEFFKSGDISASAFMFDQIFAVGGVIAATALISAVYLHFGERPGFYDWFGCAIILGDAIVSPFNAFRTALRNFGVGS